MWEHKTQGVNYDRYRPSYPSSIVSLVNPEPERRSAYLDVATGTGQLLFKLYDKFERAFGVDASEQMTQVSAAKATEINQREGRSIDVQRKDCLHVHEVVAEDSRFDLVTVGEALHWFPID